jgi:YgiT-type zinc finger domain-containing protein
MSIGKMVSSIGIIVGFISQHYNTTILLVVVLGLLVDLLLNRSVDWDGYPEDTTCPICRDGELNENRDKKMFHYKGHELRLPDYERLMCDNCGGGLMKIEYQEEVNEKIEEFKQKVDDGE